MATTLDSASVQGGVKWAWRDALTLGDTTNENSFASIANYLVGNGAGQASKVFVNQYAIAASATQTLDLAGGVTDFKGVAITFAVIKEIFIQLTTLTAATAIKVGGGTDGAGTNAFVGWVANASDLVRCGNGSFIHTGYPGATGFPVTGGTGDILGIINEDSSAVATVNVYLLGTN